MKQEVKSFLRDFLSDSDNIKEQKLTALKLWTAINNECIEFNMSTVEFSEPDNGVVYEITNLMVEDLKEDALTSRIDAIKQLRSKTGCTLLSAKKFIDRICPKPLDNS